jgi:hypothetical protein
MKKGFVVSVLAGSMLLVSSFCFAGDKEELVLKQQLLQERQARIEAQAQILQVGYKQTQDELKDVTDKLNILIKKEEAAKNEKEKEAKTKK